MSGDVCGKCASLFDRTVTTLEKRIPKTPKANEVDNAVLRRRDPGGLGRHGIELGRGVELVVVGRNNSARTGRKCLLLRCPGGRCMLGRCPNSQT
jgi:hypothetical protein